MLPDSGPDCDSEHSNSSVIGETQGSVIVVATHVLPQANRPSHPVTGKFMSTAHGVQVAVVLDIVVLDDTVVEVDAEVVVLVCLFEQ